MTSPVAAHQETTAAGRGGRDRLARWSAIGAALLLMAAMLGTLYEKNLVATVAPQGWSREVYGIDAALTKMKFGVGGGAIDQRLLATLMRAGFTDQPAPELGAPYPDNLRNAGLIQEALRKATTIDLTPPDPGDVDGRDLLGFSGEDTGIATYAYLSFLTFGVTIPGLTFFYFVILAVSLVLYSIGHWRDVGALAAVVALMLALYLIVCADFMNFFGASAYFRDAGIDPRDPRFLGTLAAVPVLHVIMMWTRPDYRVGPLDYVVLALQAAIFALALQIRSPAAWALLALTAFWLLFVALALRRGRSLRALLAWRDSRSVLAPLTVLIVLGAAQLAAAASLHPVYRAQGDIPRHMFWQGVLSSLQLEPEWSTKYGAWASGATDDAMPATVARNAIMKLPAEQRRQYLNRDGATKRTALEKFSRIAFFDILRNDPKFVAHAFFIDKPLRALRSEQEFFFGLFSGLPAWNALVPVAAVGVLVVIVSGCAAAVGTLRATAAVLPLFVVVAWLPNWLVILNAMVMIDNFVWLSFLLVVLLVLAAAAVRVIGAGKTRPKMTAVAAE